MTYTYITDEIFNLASIVVENVSIPLDPANSDYQKVLDDIIEQGTECWNGDIPDILQTAADAKQFAKQSQDYKIAVDRLAQYRLSEGKPETTENIVVGQSLNTETGQVEDIIQTVVIEEIPALDATIEVQTGDMNNPQTQTIENPLITKDNAERAAAQAIIDSTPQAVKDTF